jgi:hypothetical protein
MTKGKVAESPDELLKWIKDPNPGFHTEHRRILDRQPEPKSQRLLLTDRDSHTAIKGTENKIFTLQGLSQGIVKVLRNPEADTQQDEGAAMSPVSSDSVTEGEGASILDTILYEVDSSDIPR